MSRVLAVVTDDLLLEKRIMLICQGVKTPLNPTFYADFDACLAGFENPEGSSAVAVLVDQSTGKVNARASESRSSNQAVLFYQSLRSIGGHRYTPLLVIDSPITPVHLARGSEYTFFRIVDKSGHESVLQSSLGALAAEIARPSALRQSFQRIAAAWKNGHEGEVEHILEECYQTFNDDEEVLLEYGSFCLRKGQMVKAEKVFAKLVNKPSQSLRVANFLARVQLKQGDFTGALSILDRANLMSPGNLDRLVLMGDAFRMQGRMTDAEKKYEEALDLDGSFGDAKKGIGLVALSQGEMDRAIDFFRGTCTEEETVGFFNNTAVMAVKRAQFEHAEQLYHTAAGVVATPKTQAKVHFNLGLMYRRWNRESDAAESFRVALSLDSNFEKAERHLSALSAGVGEIAGIGNAHQSLGFDGSDETLIGSANSSVAGPETASGVIESTDAAVGKKSFPGVAAKSSARTTGPVTGVDERTGGVAQAGAVRTVNLPSKDVKPFAAEHFSQTPNQKNVQRPQSQSAKNKVTGVTNVAASKQLPRFIHDESTGADGEAESNTTTAEPKKVG